MTTPSDAASQLLSALTYTDRDHPPAMALNCSADAALNIISRAIALALTIPAGHVRDDKGVDRKVLGMLPMTKDGCVVGNGAVLHYATGRKHPKAHKHEPTQLLCDSSDYECGHYDPEPHKCFATPEAAVAAAQLSGKEKK